MWTERVAVWAASGESMRAFALRHGWTARQLAWWKKRLAEVPADTPGGQEKLRLICEAAGGTQLLLSPSGTSYRLVAIQLCQT